MKTATVGARCQVVIPKVVRERVGLKAHSRVTVRASGSAVLIELIGAGARGIGRELADGADATAYVRQLRSEWDARS